MIDMTFTELDDSWRTYSQLTLSEGRIRLCPITKTNICASVQWVRDCIRMSEDPSNFIFLGDRADPINKYKNTHKQWADDAHAMMKSIMPKHFKDDMKWLDWKASLVRFLSTQPEQNGVPLSYIVHDNDALMYQVNVNFLDNYIDRAPLMMGAAYTLDTAKVHIFI